MDAFVFIKKDVLREKFAAFRNGPFVVLLKKF